MSVSRFSLSVLLCSALHLVAGCAAPTEESSAADEAAIVARPAALVGSYKGDTGPFRGLILTSSAAGANTFRADVATGVQCITTPCPTSERVLGTFEVTKTTITFESITASDLVQPLLGRFEYVLEGGRLSLSRPRERSEQALAKTDDYCGQPRDCEVQGVVHPFCVGSFRCSAEATCQYTCGTAPPKADRCASLDASSCLGDASCEPVLGPSDCTPEGICTADLTVIGCASRS